MDPYLDPPFYEETIYEYNPFDPTPLPITSRQHRFIDELVQTVKELYLSDKPTCHQKNSTTNA